MNLSRWSLGSRLVAVAVAGSVAALAVSFLIDDTRERLITVQLDQLRRSGIMVAGLIGEAASQQGPVLEDGSVRHVIQADRARLLVWRVVPVQTRLRLFDMTGQLVVDTGPPSSELRNLLPPMPMRRQVDETAAAKPADAVPPIAAAPPPPIDDFPEAKSALFGAPGERVLVDDQGITTLSIAPPIWYDDQIIGALVITSQVPGIDAFARRTVLQVVLALVTGLAVSVAGIVLLMRQLRRSVSRYAEATDLIVRREASTMPAIVGPGRVLAPVADSVIRLNRVLQERAEQADSFAKEMVHELKNPLTSLRSAVETAERISNPEQHMRLMSVIVADVVRLDRLISAITDVSQVEAELAAIPGERVDLAAMASAIIEIENAAWDSEFDPRFDLVTGGGPFQIKGVESRLAQVFRNVLRNARSFSPPGGSVRLALARQGDLITITCEDDAPGLPPGKEAAIFQRFYSDRPVDQPFAGHSGLGLSLCRQIVAAHHGAIWAENRQDAFGRIIGARFVIRLPSANR